MLPVIVSVAVPGSNDEVPVPVRPTKSPIASVTTHVFDPSNHCVTMKLPTREPSSHVSSLVSSIPSSDSSRSLQAPLLRPSPSSPVTTTNV